MQLFAIAADGVHLPKSHFADVKKQPFWRGRANGWGAMLMSVPKQRAYRCPPGAHPPQMPPVTDERGFDMELSRRTFVKNAGIAGAGVLATAGATTALADEAAAASDQPWMPEEWAYETDVVLVGSGSAITAALRAYDEGLDVIVLEKHPTWFGGTTAFSGGGMMCPNATRALELGSREIPRDILKDYFLNVAEGQSSEELIDMMIDNCPAAVDYMNNECGFNWTSSEPNPQMSYNFYFGGTPITDEYADTPVSVFIGMHEATGTAAGRAIQAFSKDAVDARGIPVLMGTAATTLIYAGDPALGDGEVVGVWATDPDGNEIAIKARYAVVLGTGGFDQNQEMVKHYINHPICTTCAIETNTGDGHIMAMELGANMRNMNEVFNHCFNMAGHPDRYVSADVSLDDGFINSEQQNPIWITPGRVGSIIVNKHGERFVCEGVNYDLFGRAWDTYDTGRREWRNIPGYVIVDSTFNGSFGNGTPTLSSMVESGEFPEWMHAFNTMEELADGMGIDKEGLLATVERWNAMCEEGVDKDWCRGESTWDKFTTGDMSRVESGELKNPSMAPLSAEGPYYCVELYPGMLATSGGIEINGNAQVKNVRGEVIPRLYAASNCIASPTGRAYAIGGNAIANGFIVGYVAANHIATLEPWE